MELDVTTYNDLSIIQHEEEFTVFNKLNFTETIEGREWLLRFFKTPFSDRKRIEETQQVVKTIINKLDDWPKSISNGTLMVLGRFYESSIDSIPSQPHLMNAASYKIFHSSDFSLVKYSLTHFADFLRGMKHLVELLLDDHTPGLLGPYLHRAKDLMKNHFASELADTEQGVEFTWKATVYYGKYIRDHFKNAAFELISIYGRLDAWRSVTISWQTCQLSFPKFGPSDYPLV